MKKTTFDRNALQHYCQKSHDGSVIFYSLSDYLVFLSIFFKYCRDLKIRPRAFCIMRNHFHFNAYLSYEPQGARLMMLVCSRFAFHYNRRPGIIKIKFKKGFSRSEKWSSKDKKSCDIYIGNNPVEKQQCSRAEDYRWNLLKYRDNPHPWSQPIVKGNASKNLCLAVAAVDDTFGRGHYLTYGQIDTILNRLTPEEVASLSDHIVHLYSNLDYDSLFKPFGNAENYLQSLNTISGSDYEISGDRTKEDYRHYCMMDSLLEKYGLRGNMERLTGLPLGRLTKMLVWLKDLSGATAFELSRYVHIGRDTIHSCLEEQRIMDYQL